MCLQVIQDQTWKDLVIFINVQIGVVVLVFAVYLNKHHILNNVQIGIKVSVIAVYLNIT